MRGLICVTVLSLCMLSVRAQVCGENELAENTRDYVNHLMDLVKQQADNVKNGKFAFIEEFHADIGKGFEQAGCGEMWEKTFTKDDRDQASIATFMANHKPVWADSITPEVVDFIKEMEQFSWLMMKDHIFSGCMVSNARDAVFRWLTEKCEPGLFVYLADDIKDFPVPKIFDDLEYEKNLRAVITILAKAYVKAMDCANDEGGIDEVIGHIVQRVDEDFCYGATDSFQSDVCYKQFTINCPKVHKCFERYVMKMQKEAPETFEGDGAIIVRCLQRSKEHWGNQRPLGVPKHSKILAKGLRLYRKLMSVNFNRASFPYIRAIVKATLRPDTCDCNSGLFQE